MFLAARATVSAIRFVRVSGRLTLLIHCRMPFCEYRPGAVAPGLFDLGKTLQRRQGGQ
jgi:hypothetical protein